MRRGFIFGFAVTLLFLATAPVGSAELAGSKQRRAPAGFVDGGLNHTCARLKGGAVRCWGASGNGQLGYGNTTPIGDTETPGSVNPVNLGPGRTAIALALGDNHSCAILDGGAVRCWGEGDLGRLGYGNTSDVGNDEAPGLAGPVVLGGRAIAITAGVSHTCALLRGGAVRCWGNGASGRLGYGNVTSIGDTETPASAGSVDLGPGRTAVAIAAGDSHTCAILDNGKVRCWGNGASGRLGYGNVTPIGDTETPGSVGTVDIGAGRTAVAISAGGSHTCVILDNGRVRCWGNGAAGRLGYGNVTSIGDTETPGSVGTVDLGAGRKAVAISAGFTSTCAVLDNGKLLCWGAGGSGQLGHGNVDSIGDNETPASAGPVNLGPGRTAVAVSVGSGSHVCAVLDNGRLRCWGSNASGQLGYPGSPPIGDTETPDTAGPVSVGGDIVPRLRPVLTQTLKPKRDGRFPYTFRATGALSGFILDRAQCSGTIVVRAKSAGKTVIRRPALRLGSSRCSYSAKLKVGARRVEGHRVVRGERLAARAHDGRKDLHRRIVSVLLPGSRLEPCFGRC